MLVENLSVEVDTDVGLHVFGTVVQHLTREEQKSIQQLNLLLTATRKYTLSSTSVGKEDRKG
jgi:hypothetical protein